MQIWRRAVGRKLLILLKLDPMNLLGMEIGELVALIEREGEPTFRAHQLFHAIYQERSSSVEAISTLPKALRERLTANGIRIEPARLDKRFTSVDGTVRYLLSFNDGQSAETVWMPDG